MLPRIPSEILQLIEEELDSLKTSGREVCRTHPHSPRVGESNKRPSEPLIPSVLTRQHIQKTLYQTALLQGDQIT
jgi:hypothetical protein